MSVVLIPYAISESVQSGHVDPLPTGPPAPDRGHSGAGGRVGLVAASFGGELGVQGTF